MGKMSRDKGKRYERELANALKEYGYDAHRTAQVTGKTGQAADVVGLPGIHIEAKHVEQMRLYEWMAQAVRDSEAAGKGDLPAVFHRKNNERTLVTMRLEDWMTIYKEWEAGQWLARLRCRDCKWWSGDAYRECTSPNWDTKTDEYFITPAGFYCGWCEKGEFDGEQTDQG